MKPIAILFLCSVVASAACPDGYPNVRNEYADSKFVLTGRVSDERKTPDSSDGYYLEGSRYKVVPTHVYKGTIEGSIELFSENSSGRFPMVPGKEYLLFVYEEHGRFRVSNCGNSNLIAHAKKAAAEVTRLSGK
jgi:hypothetical protein